MIYTEKVFGAQNKMKRRQRKPVLDINGDSDSPRRRWPNERQSYNGSPSNPLANLIGQYNSDSEAEDESRPRTHVLNDQVNDFLKEIQSIAPEDSNKDEKNSSMAHPGSYWQECYDEQTGYPYYWHTETNQVTWEMPAELKMLHEKSQRESTAPRGSHIPQWSNLSQNKYIQSQSNIPEGMIPKEVVARNRNRQAGILNKPAKPPIKADVAKSSGFSKDDSSDEGKIEMITSFGNDESESDESDNEESKKNSSCLTKSSIKSSQYTKLPTPSLQEQSNKVSESNDSRLKTEVGPALSRVQFGPINQERLSEKLSQNVQAKSSREASSNNEEDILKRLKNQAQMFKGNSTTKGDLSKLLTSGDADSAKDLKLSLVPGYEDDSDGDEESPRKQNKPLFPSAESIAGNDKTVGDKISKRIEINNANVRIYDYRNVGSDDKIDGANDGIDTTNASEEKQEDSKVDLESKAKQFLESIDAPNKAFQRKKRIAFDVAPNKNKSQDCTGTKDDFSNTSNTTPLLDVGERRGLGFAREESRNSPEGEANARFSTETTNKKNTISFIKSTEDENSNSNSNSNKPKEISETEKAELKALTDPIIEKLKFLSEGSPAASAVQVMAIQIQTLLSAWESGDLQESYLRNWLVGTGCELTRLEQTAAPPGWECQWDRSHKRYYYRNTSTGDAQWTYPETDIVGGTEEMELCTTPPPPEHEEAPIIEMSVQTRSMSNEKSDEPEQQQQQQQQQQQGSATTTGPPPPPPPMISSPSPPPPPRIFAEDLKRGKKRKESPDDNSDRTIEELAKEDKPRGPEPLPPGVDPPEIAYTLPASALEAGVLYGAQQTNPIYAATLAGAGIPIIPHHPHTALMQSQLMHYNPAYHQHFHNQALVAARLSSQEAVQFMVAEYARVYENNQVIAKPPIKMPHETSLGSAINSFYSDIASIEKTTADIEKEKAEMRMVESTPSPVPQVPTMEPDSAANEANKDRKKKKLKTGIGKKQKEMSSMVAKWQRAQKNYKEGN